MNSMQRFINTPYMYIFIDSSSSVNTYFNPNSIFMLNHIVCRVLKLWNSFCCFANPKSTACTSETDWTTWISRCCSMLLDVARCCSMLLRCCPMLAKSREKVWSNVFCLKKTFTTRCDCTFFSYAKRSVSNPW